MSSSDQNTQNTARNSTETFNEQRAMSGRPENGLDADEISLKEIIQKLRRLTRYLLSRWLPIFIGCVFGGMLGLGYSKLKKPEYTATTTFVLESGDGGGGDLGQYAGIASMVGIDIGGGGGGIFQEDNIIELYKSRTMIEKTLLSKTEINGEKRLLIDLFLDANNQREGWAKESPLNNFNNDVNAGKTFSRLQDSLLGTIVRDINQNYMIVDKPDQKLSIIRVVVKANNEVFAKAFNDLIVKNVNDFYVQTKTKKSLENVAILEQKADSVRRVMNGAIYSVAAVGDATPNLNPTRQVQRAAPMQRFQFNAETNKAILGELVKSLEMSRMALRKETPLIQVIDKPIFPLEKHILGKAKGILLGGLLGGILSVIFLLFNKLFRSIVN